MVKQRYDLDTPVLQLPDGDNNQLTYSWTLRQAFNGLAIFGGIGSGKTSGSGKMIALKYLSMGWGGLVLTAKTDEKSNWQELCKLTGRTDDLIIIEPGGEHFFNIIEHLAAGGEQQAFVENIVHVLGTVIRAGQQKQNGGEDSMFWETALHMTMFNVINLCQLAYGDKISLQLIYEVAQSLPKKQETGVEPPTQEQQRATAYARAFIMARQRVDELEADYRKTLSDTEKAMDKHQLDMLLEDAIPQLRTMKQVDNFFFEVLHNLSTRTRSVIDFLFMGFLFGLLQDPIYSLLSKRKATFKFSDCYEQGKIILVNLPVKKYHKVGRDCQVMLKLLWQQAMEIRDVEHNERPVFLWADESQHFLHSYDSEYQATARSQRIATVYISQNLPNYHANMNSDKSEYLVKSFLGTLATKVFHANADIETNRYASDLIGEAWTQELQMGDTIGNKDFSASRTASRTLRKMVRPEQLVGLKTGGKENNYHTVAYMHVQGKKFADGCCFKAVTFNQHYLPEYTVTSS